MLNKILTTIRQQVPFQKIISATRTDYIRENLALPGASRLPVLSALQAELQCPILLITDRTDHALTLLDELAFWLPNSVRYLFPEPNPLFYENATWGVTTRRDRLLILTILASQQIPGTPKSKEPPIIIAPARAIMTRTLPRREFIRVTKTYKIGQVYQPDALARNWIRLGYESVSTVVTSGQFARRGGILDIWPPAETHPIRIEFFGDEIDLLRRFEPSNQRTIDTIERIMITPAREFLINIDEKPSQTGDDLSFADYTSNQVSEFHIPILNPTKSSLLDYLPKDALVLIENQEAFRESVFEIEEQALALRQDYIEEGTIPADFPVPYITWDHIQDFLSIRSSLELGPATSQENDLGAGITLSELFTHNPRFGGRLKGLFEHLNTITKREDDVVIVSRQAARLEELWEEKNRSRSSTSSQITFIQGGLSEGWIFTSIRGERLHFLTDGEIFGWRRPKPRKRPRPVAEAPEAAYADLKPGNLVAHVDHGIGRFMGLVTREIDKSEREYLEVEYAEGDQLFVPVHQADRLTRYVGPEKRQPILTRLGGTRWRSAKSKVKEAVEGVAEDMLELYAKRHVVRGHSFGRDTPWQKELEASFPYIETEDQVRVVEEVKRDMESVRPMDRLICGDVGYGKTEVALRAAFKAVMDGKQVALLVPTTVLAQQHYDTFKARLAAFPVEVEMLSRFRTPQQQRDILFRLSKGSVDIVIGTHRLMSGDVNFKDLGLLIIDEEQRFGVTHKETLKKLRTEVDVLTMTATPIPRTLYMTLTGIRDISTINTPPEERLPVITFTGPYSPRLVKRAVIRELERGGQIFFVHNRVQTIAGIGYHLKKITPEARVGIAHGQMPEIELSKRMREFTNGEIDILLCTSIIESGLDIPNANTLIVDRADTFGLAQLYQLRGRVGRGAQRAYAYFFKHPRKSPTRDGRERLDTIAEHTQLGAGFSIAMRDLEIRGSGDILGTRQHGNIAAVGFHLYTRMLASAVRRLRVDKQQLKDADTVPIKELRLPVSVDLPISATIPADYVPDRDVRLNLYRRLADLLVSEDVEAMSLEFVDRFGSLPMQMENLFYLTKIKLLAEAAGLASVSSEQRQIVMRFAEGNHPPQDLDLGSEVRVGKTALWMEKTLHGHDWPAVLLGILRKMSE